MRFKYLPCGGKHAAIFVRVGVAKHDLLPASPCIKKTGVLGRTPKLTTDLRRVTQVLNGFKEGYRHQAGVIAMRLNTNATATRKPNGVPDVLHACGSADHVGPNGLRWIFAF